jgi:putative membrane protein
MRKIAHIFARDFRHLFMNFSITLVAIGISVIPALYAWFNIEADMDPYSKTNNISVAVASDDQTVHTAALGDLNVGTMLITKLKKNHQLGWKFTTSAKAIQSVKSAQNFAAVVVPRDFSHKIADLADFSSSPSPDTAQMAKPAFDYYVNEKISAIAPKVTDAGAQTLEKTINTTIVRTASEAIAQRIQASAGKLRSSVHSTSDQAAASVSQAASWIGQSRLTLATLADQFAHEQKTLKSVQSQLLTLARQTDGVRTTLHAAAPALPRARLHIMSATAQLQSIVNNGALSTQSALQTANQDMNTASNAVIQGQGSVQSALAQAQTISDRIGRITSAIRTSQHDIDQLVSSSDTFNQLPADVQSRIRAVQGILDGTVSSLDDTHQAGNSTIASLSTAGKQAGDLAASAAELSRTATSTASQQLSSALRLNSTVQSTLVPALDSSLSTVSQARTDLDAQLAQISSSTRSAANRVSDLNALIGKLAGVLRDTSSHLQPVQSSLSTTAHDIAAISSSEAIRQLSALIGIQPTHVGTFLASPAQLHSVTVYPVKNYGSAMTPIYTNVSLWVCCIMLVIAFRMEVDTRDLERAGIRVRPFEAYIARYLLLSIMVVLSAIIVSVGDLLLGIGVAHPVAFVFTCIICALVYLSICYMLATCFQHIGKALCIVLIVIQIPSTSGVYPIEMMPAFYQTIRPLEPWSYGMRLMRETIGGYYDASYAHALVALLIFAALAFAIGLGIRGKMTNLNGMFDRRIARTDFFNGEEGDLPPAHVSLRIILQTLASRADVRRKIVKRAVGFDRAYPYLIGTGFVLLFLLPVVPFLMALTPNTKLVSLGIWVIIVILVLGFVIIIEYVHEALHRELDLANLTDADLQTMMRTQTDQSDATNATDQYTNEHDHGEQSVQSSQAPRASLNKEAR